MQHISLYRFVSGVEEATRVLEWAERDYPNSALFLYFKSRILRLQVTFFIVIYMVDKINPFNASCSKLLLFDGFSAILV